MISVNEVELIGNVGNSPVLEKTKNQKSVVKIRLATTDNFKKANGEKVQDTQWHNVTFYDKIAEVVAEYVKKGQQIRIKGKIRNSIFDGKDGQKKYYSEVIALNMQMGSTPNNQNNDVQQNDNKQKNVNSNFQQKEMPKIEEIKFTKTPDSEMTADSEDDLPF